MLPDGKRDTVVPDSFRIILAKYLRHREAKSLAPNGGECLSSTCGLLRRAKIVAGELVSIGKETDRSWEQGEDPSVLDFKLNEYGKQSKMVIADRADRKRWVILGKRPVIRKSGLSQTTVFAILKGETVRRTTLAIFTRAING